MTKTKEEYEIQMRQQKIIDSLQTDGFGLFVFDVKDVESNNGIVVRGYTKSNKIYVHLSDVINDCDYHVAYVRIVKKVMRRPYVELTFYPNEKRRKNGNTSRTTSSS